MRSFAKAGLFSLFLLLYFGSICLANKDTIINKGQIKLEPAASISYSGFNTSVSVSKTFKNHVFYLGPKVSLNYFTTADKGPYGFITGYRYQINCEKKLKSFTSLEYQHLFIRQTNFENTEKHFGHIHELYLGYGLELKLFERWHLGNEIGFGGYYENHQDQLLNKKRTHQDFYPKIKLFLNYGF